MEVESSMDINSLQPNEVPPIHERDQNVEVVQENELRMETETDCVSNRECNIGETNQPIKEPDQAMQVIEKTCNALESKLKESIPTNNEHITKDTSLDDQVNKENQDTDPNESENVIKSSESEIDQPDKTEKKIQQTKSPEDDNIMTQEHKDENLASENKNLKHEGQLIPSPSEKTFSIRRLGDVDGNGKFKLSNKDLTKDELAQRYRSIVYKWEEDEVICTICMETESFEDDIIIICDLCNSSFHQECYGSELLSINEDDDSEWFCARCAYLLDNDLPFNKIRCEFCPEMKGAIKRIKENSDEHWGHMLCVNWIPEMYYLDDEKRIDVKIEEYWNLDSCGRKTMTCEFCKVKYGDNIQCDDKKCRSAFHVTCAQRHGLICCWQDMADLKRKNDEEYYYPIYCKKHMKAYCKKMFDFSNQVEHKNKTKGSKISFLYDAPTVTNHKKSPVASNTTPEKDHKVKVKQRERESNNSALTEKKAESKVSKIDSRKKSENLHIKDLSDALQKEAKDIQEIHDLVEAGLEKSDFFHTLQIPKGIKAKKSASFVNPLAELSNSSILEDLYDTDEESTLYKFRPDIAQLLKFEDWADEIRMKRVIQNFIKDKGLYDKETEKVVVSRNAQLKQILDVVEIPRAQIFSKFKPHMVKKPADGNSNKKRKSSTGPEIYENDIAQMRQEKKVKLNSAAEDSKTMKKCAINTSKAVVKKSSPLSHENKENGAMAIRKGNEIPPDRTVKTTTRTEVPPPKLAKRKSEQIAEEQKLNGEEIKLKKSTSSLTEKKKEHSKSMDTSDFLSSFSNFGKKAQTPKASEINMNSSSFLENFMAHEKAPVQARVSKENNEQKYEGLSSLISRSTDQISFRKPMNWFVQTELIYDGEINFSSSDMVERLWPKGAELLF